MNARNENHPFVFLLTLATLALAALPATHKVIGDEPDGAMQSR